MKTSPFCDRGRACWAWSYECCELQFKLGQKRSRAFQPPQYPFVVKESQTTQFIKLLWIRQSRAQIIWKVEHANQDIMTERKLTKLNETERIRVRVSAIGGAMRDILEMSQVSFLKCEYLELAARCLSRMSYMLFSHDVHSNTVCSQPWQSIKWLEAKQQTQPILQA